MVEESQSTDDTLVDSIMLTRAAMKNSRCVLVITGAGISAESGVPTFRGAGGYWRNRHFTELAKPEAFAADPKLVWEWYCERRRTVAACEPNAAHHVLARWAKSRVGVTLVTQNVDGLHERAGHPDVIRLHGSLWRKSLHRVRRGTRGALAVIRLIADAAVLLGARASCDRMVR